MVAIRYLYLLFTYLDARSSACSKTNYLEEYERKKYMIKYVDCRGIESCVNVMCEMLSKDDYILCSCRALWPTFLKLTDSDNLGITDAQKLGFLVLNVQLDQIVVKDLKNENALGGFIANQIVRCTRNNSRFPKPVVDRTEYRIYSVWFDSVFLGKTEPNIYRAKLNF